MACRYNVVSYRPVICQNDDCSHFGEIIPLDYTSCTHVRVGESWRTFCPECGDGAGLTLQSVEWDDSIPVAEVVLHLRIQLVPDVPDYLPNVPPTDEELDDILFP